MYKKGDILLSSADVTFYLVLELYDSTVKLFSFDTEAKFVCQISMVDFYCEKVSGLINSHKIGRFYE